MRKRLITVAAFLLMAALLVYTALFSHASYAFSSFLLILLALVPFYASFERQRPQARELVPIAIMAALAAVGRVIFAPFPQIKPVSAIVIVAGMALGPQSGFITGATAALVSNFFFGQGPFTPWQMFAWGIMGLCAGVFAKIRLPGFLGKAVYSRAALCVYGFVWGFLYGWIMDLYQVLGFVSPITPKSFFLTFAASFYFDLTHAVSTAVFLLLIAKPWLKLLRRVKIKYGLMKIP